MEESKKMAKIACAALADKKEKISKSLISQMYQFWQIILLSQTEPMTAKYMLW